MYFNIFPTKCLMVQYPRDPHQPDMRRLDTIHNLSELSSQMHHTKLLCF